VTITVLPPNVAPVANDQQVAFNQGQGGYINLSASDENGDNLTYLVVSQPINGKVDDIVGVSGNPSSINYSPNSDFVGTDTFTFKVNDGTIDSEPATVSITVTAVNSPPVATAQSVTTDEDTAVAITLAGTDADGDSLTHTVVTQPGNGALSGTAPTLTYTPNANYNGDDSFTFKVNDGTVDSATVTVSITVTAVDDPPVATAQSVIINEDTAVRIELHGQGTDVDNGDWGMLIWALVSEPNNGTLKKPEEDHGPYSPGTIYIPNTNYNGNDSFTFKVFNEQDSEPATVSVTVTAVNDLPVANDQSVEVGQNMPQHPITLSASDADGDSLTYLLVSNPSNGQLSGTPPNLTYTPNADYDGADSFTFKVNDGTVDSEPATVSITVTAVNDAPVAQDILIDDWFQPGMSVGINLLSTAC
jgi:hypothetical protein